MSEPKTKKRTLEGTSSYRAKVAETLIEKIFPVLERNVDFESSMRCITEIDHDTVMLTFQILLPTQEWLDAGEPDEPETCEQARQRKMH